MEKEMKEMEETLYQIGLKLDKFYPFHNIHNIDRMKWFIKAYETLTKKQ
jgi:hypothetical protein